MSSLVEIDIVILNLKLISDFKNIFDIILHFRYYLPLEKGVALHLTKLESSSSKDAVPSLDETSPVVLEKKILRCFQYNFTFLQLSLLVERRGLSFE